MPQAEQAVQGEPVVRVALYPLSPLVGLQLEAAVETPVCDKLPWISDPVSPTVTAAALLQKLASTLRVRGDGPPLVLVVVPPAPAEPPRFEGNVTLGNVMACATWHLSLIHI